MTRTMARQLSALAHTLWGPLWARLHSTPGISEATEKKRRETEPLRARQPPAPKLGTKRQRSVPPTLPEEGDLA